MLFLVGFLTTVVVAWPRIIFMLLNAHPLVIEFVDLFAVKTSLEANACLV